MGTTVAAGGVLEGLKLGAKALEDAQIVVEFLQQTVDDGFHRIEQAAVAVGIRRPTLGRVGKAVEQASRGVWAMGEQLAIKDRSLEIRKLQSSQQDLHLRRQGVVFEDELEQHADQIDGV